MNKIVEKNFDKNFKFIKADKKVEIKKDDNSKVEFSNSKK